jgi:hypothetical protein
LSSLEKGNQPIQVGAIFKQHALQEIPHFSYVPEVAVRAGDLVRTIRKDIEYRSLNDGYFPASV